MESQLEYAIIGDFISGTQNVETLRQLVKQYSLESSYFQDNDAQRAFLKILEDAEIADSGVLQRRIMELVGPAAVERMAHHSTVSLVDAEANIRDLAKRGHKAEIEAITNMTLAQYGSSMATSQLIDEILRRLGGFKNKLAPEIEGLEATPLSAFSNDIPEEERPDRLFPNGWFRKGQAMMLTSVAGSGKSVLTTQLCYAWASGYEIFGLKPFEKLRIGIIQTEDDRDEIAEFRESMRRGYSLVHGWSEADLDEAESRIFFFDPKGKMNLEFIEYFRAIQQKYHFDLVVINPLQGVAGIDLGVNKELSVFLRDNRIGLDSIIRNEETRCGLLIVHHTNKPPTGADRMSFGTDKYAQYVGGGGREINGWMRGMLLLLPTSEPGSYCLSAVKRGGRLDWTNPPGGKTYAHPTKIICHSPREDQMLFWREVGLDDLPQSLRGRPKRETVSLEQGAQELAKWIDTPRTAGELREKARELFGKRQGDLVQAELVDNPNKYGLEKQKVPKTSIVRLMPKSIFGKDSLSQK